jgi:hypothetical protein
LPKFKLKFRREPRDDGELERFVRSTMASGGDVKSFLNRAWDSFVPLLGDQLNQV